MNNIIKKKNSWFYPNPKGRNNVNAFKYLKKNNNVAIKCNYNHTIICCN